MFSKRGKHKCLLMEQTVPLLFLTNPSPNANFSKFRGKKIEFLLGSNPILLCNNFDRQSEALTTQLLLVLKYNNIRLKIKSTGAGLRKISFSLPGGIPLYFEMGMGKGCQFESTLHENTIRYPIFSTYPPIFYLHFLNIEVISCLEKGFII